MRHAPRLRVSAVAGMAAVAVLLCLAHAYPLAQETPAPGMGRIHGRVINPAGMAQTDGTVSLSTDGGDTLSYNFPVSQTGEYSGQAPEGEYTVVYRAPDTPEGKIVDYVPEVEIAAGKDTAQDVDMTRQEFIDRLSPEQQQQLQELKQANAAALSARPDIASITADLQIANLDFEAAANARATATATLGADAAKEDVDVRTGEIENAKLTEVETLMKRDATADPGEPVLWIDMARAEVGLKNFLDAETNYKKALDLATKADQPRPEVIAAADAGLGEVYARTLMVDEANAAFDAAAKADPPNAGLYFRNQAIIFFQEGNSSAQVDAADAALKLEPNEAILYFIKASGLAQNATVDPDTNKLILPPGCADAYRKYLELAPNGPRTAEITAILQRAEESTSTATAPATTTTTAPAAK